MNKRIKELAVLATKTVDHTGAFGLTQTTSTVDLEKFAELIVKECIFLNMNELTHIENEILIPAYEKHFGNLYPKP